MLQFARMRRRFLDLGIALLLVVIFAIIAFTVRISMAPFVRIGMQAVKVLHGQETLFDSEYPPLASSLFYLLQINPLTSFNSGWKMMLTTTLLLVTIFVGTQKPWESIFLGIATLLTIPLLGTEVTLARYDLLVTFLLCMAWLGTEHRRDLSAGISLGLAASLKIVPILLFPFLWLRSGRKMRLSLGMSLGLIIGLFVPFMLLGVDVTMQNLFYLRSFHEVRGIQLESTWAGLYLLFSAITGQFVTIDNVRRAFEVMVPSWIPTLATILTLGGLAFLFRPDWKRSSRSLPPLALLWILFMTPVLSPQYFVWIVPLLLFEALRQIVTDAQSRYGWLLLALTILTALLTHWIYPILYDQLVHLVLWPILILNLRTLCLLGLLVLLWQENTKQQFQKE